jgi:hypothetical protein
MATADRRTPVAAVCPARARPVRTGTGITRRATRTRYSLICVSGPRPREVIDYALARRATLTDLLAGRSSRLDACDAHPYLLRAARHHGEPTDVSCPVCRHADPLTHVTYVYGDGLGEASGRACATRDFGALAAAHGEIRAYVVEVCQHCSWNHLVSSAVYGQARPRTAGRRRTAER